MKGCEIVQLHKRIVKEIEVEKEAINNIRFGKIEITVTVQDGKPHMIDIGTNRKRKCSIELNKD